LFTYPDQKEPFADLANFEAVKKEIKSLTDDKIKNLFRNIPSNTLQELLLDCCKVNPDQRLSFEQLEAKYDSKEDDLFAKILKELDNTANVTNKIWNDAISSKKVTQKAQEGVQFNKFFEFLTDDCFKLANPEGQHYLKQALRLPFWLKPNDEDPKYISREQFDKVCFLFKFTKEDEKSGYNNFIKRIVDIFSRKWFYGSVVRENVQAALDKKSPLCLSFNWWNATTAYVVRYSNQGQFCITFKNKNDPGGFENATIDPTAALNEDGYRSYISKYKRGQQKSRNIYLKYDQKTDLERSFNQFKKNK